MNCFCVIYKFKDQYSFIILKNIILIYLQSDEIINVYKEDLQEFSRTIVADTSAVIKDKVDMFNSLDSKAARSSSNTHLQARILRIQRDPKTYPYPPSDSQPRSPILLDPQVLTRHSD